MSQKKLSERDGIAVDALLMNGRNMNPPTPPSPNDDERTEAARKVLSPLELLDDEVPPGLADNFLRNLELPPPLPRSGFDSPPDMPMS